MSQWVLCLDIMSLIYVHRARMGQAARGMATLREIEQRLKVILSRQLNLTVVVDS